MSDRIIRAADGRAYRCEGCPYRNRLTGYCGFCMRKILDEMREKEKETKEDAKDGKA